MRLKLIAVAAAVAFSGAAYAQKDDAARKAKDQEEERIEQQAKADRERCNQMKDNAQDICEAEAKGKEKVAKKELDYKKNPNERNARDVEKIKKPIETMSFDPFDRSAQFTESQGQSMDELLATFAELRQEKIAVLRGMGNPANASIGAPESA